MHNECKDPPTNSDQKPCPCQCKVQGHDRIQNKASLNERVIIVSVVTCASSRIEGILRKSVSCVSVSQGYNERFRIGLVWRDEFTGHKDKSIHFARFLNYVPNDLIRRILIEHVNQNLYRAIKSKRTYPSLIRQYWIAWSVENLNSVCVAHQAIFSQSCILSVLKRMNEMKFKIQWQCKEKMWDRIDRFEYRLRSPL